MYIFIKRLEVTARVDGKVLASSDGMAPTSSYFKNSNRLQTLSLWVV